MPKVRGSIAEVEADGWVLHHTRGSHRQYRHPVKAGTVTIPGHPGEDMDPGIVHSIYRQVQIQRKKR